MIIHVMFAFQISSQFYWVGSKLKICPAMKAFFDIPFNKSKFCKRPSNDYYVNWFQSSF